MSNKYIKGNIILPTHIIQGRIEFNTQQILSIREENLDTHAKKQYIFPGFIDIHTHGCLGYGVMDATPESILHIAQGKAAQGVTHFLPTTLTAEKAVLQKTLMAIKEAHTIQKNRFVEGAKIMGIHLEGPYISASRYRGAQNPKYITMPDAKECDQYRESSGHLIHLVTLAPEKKQALHLIRHLVAQNIRVSVGHSEANAQQMKDAVQAGITSATHLFNGMKEFNHYDIGCVGTALIDDSLYCEVIGDGKHVVFEALELLFRCKPKDKIMFITDSAPCSGLEDGSYMMSEVKVMLRNNEVRTEEGGMAGSVVGMDEIISNVMNTFIRPTHPHKSHIKYHQLSMVDLAKMVSTNQSIFLNYSTIGKIALGYQANFALFDESFSLQKTYREGEVIFEN